MWQMGLILIQHMFTLDIYTLLSYYLLIICMWFVAFITNMISEIIILKLISTRDLQILCISTKLFYLACIFHKKETCKVSCR